ncbi:hypothetical protein [Roseisolibacter sp. H3M3-2]|uniref:hypothetical protein n=1 Tax=Roseisolibacter sp. H3M3-2 TaxID=3031323 RepID=UPI0023DA2D68|nr:hypothetical protein [Roseisolibacter sp. H3M3-2]MDF1504587.1 hypothetical protein [Roseisolibacter sp. H3M3-2]
MTKTSLTRLAVLCAALSACADDVTRPTLAARDSGPARDATPADLRGAATVDGPPDVALGFGGSTQMAASAQAASGGRASGHVALTLGTGFFTNVASEQYSFVALRTDPATPNAARGQYDMTLTTATGVVQEFHGIVVCMGTTGNTTRVAGQLTSVVVNGIPRAINPAASHNIWNVTDTGEGVGAADTASPMIFFPAAVAPLHCANDFIPPQFANEAGNVQVRP